MLPPLRILFKETKDVTIIIKMWWFCRGQHKVAPLQEQDIRAIVPDDNNPYGYRVHNTNKFLVCREPYDPDGRPENYIYISRRIRKKN